MLNRVQLIGNLGTDPEVKEFDNGKVVNFNLATNEFYTDKAGTKHQQTEWHNIRSSVPHVVDLVSKYLKKGDPLYCEGKIKQRSYEKDGIKHFITEIHIDKITFLPKAKANDQEDQKPQKENSEPMSMPDDDLPF